MIVRPQPALIREALDLIAVEDAIFELRAPAAGPKRTMAGYFDRAHVDAAVDAAVEIAQQTPAPAIYVTLNPVNPVLHARALNRVQAYAKDTTGNTDILHRRYLPFDLDVPRPTGISTTNDEHECALAAAAEVETWLVHTLGVPAPACILADSGNGGHLLVRADLPNDPDTEALVVKCHAAVAQHVADRYPMVKVDTTVKNAARIWKLYGTVARKGDSTAERPHRLAQILSQPDTLGICPPDILAALAGQAPASPSSPSRRASASSGERHAPVDVRGFLTEHGIEIRREKPYSTGVVLELAVCPWNPERHRGEAWVFVPNDGPISAGCLDDSCKGKRWADLREAVGAPRAARSACPLPYATICSAAPEHADDGSKPTLPTDPTVEWEDVRPWPSPDPAALYGLAGDVVRILAPHTEADPSALLLTFLALFGNAVGDGPHVRVGAIRHPARLFSCIVGATARSRKGQSFGEVGSILAFADAAWWEAARSGGLTSGEGIIARVRDDAERAVEKRALFYEPEFARTLVAAGRDGSTLSAVVRDAWDTGCLAVTTRKDPLSATGAHIGIVAHVTLEELRTRLPTLEIANGFANRFLFCCAQRSKKLPSGGNLTDDDRSLLADRVREALRVARSRTIISRTAAAEALWSEVYQQLPEPLGLFGAVTARADAQLLRLSLVFALLDQADQIDDAHVDAAVAVWRYAEASAAHVFGGTLGHDSADRLLDELRAVYPKGLTRDEQYALFGRHTTAAELGITRNLLVERELACEKPEANPGRHSQVLYAVPKHARKAREGSAEGARQARKGGAEGLFSLFSHFSHSTAGDGGSTNGPDRAEAGRDGRAGSEIRSTPTLAEVAGRLTAEEWQRLRAEAAAGDGLAVTALKLIEPGGRDA